MSTPNTTPVEQWFSARRFGLFVHFGLYSINGWHEQEQWRRGIPRDEYGALIQRFNPTAFNPDALIDLAESAGMEYLCFTAKHHDGFCLWNTKCTDFNVMNSLARRDLILELAEACQRRKFPLGLYFSIPDWHHPNYPNSGLHHQLPGPLPGDHPDWEAYFAFLNQQVLELMTHYGPIKHFFWDINVTGYSDRSVNERIRALQPGIVINNRGFDEGDFGTPEREFNTDEVARTRCFLKPTEACNSVGMQSWGYRRNEDYYTPGFLISSMDGVMCRGGHYLLNIGPKGDGSITPEQAAMVRRVGDWYLRVKEAFADATPASELSDNPQLLITKRDRSIYVHVQRPFVSSSIVIPPIDQIPLAATLLNTGESLPCSVDALPYYWATKGRYLVVRDIPLGRLPDEIPVIRLDFEHPLLPRKVDYHLSNGGKL